MMPFLSQTHQANSRLTDRVRKKHRRRRDAELWWSDPEMVQDDPIGHLVVPRPADAVDELVGDEKPQEHRQGESTRRKPVPSGSQKLPKCPGRFKRVGSGVENK